MKKSKTPSALAIAGAYIGTIVGAGFASGQEVLQFFGFFGVLGIMGLLVSTGLFIYFGLHILEAGRKLKAKSHLPVIRHFGGPLAGTAIDGVITFFLFGALAVMAAGSGAIFFQEFRLSPLLGSLAMLLVSLLTVLLGIRGVVSAISFVAPLLLAAVLGTSLLTLLMDPGVFVRNLDLIQAGRASVSSWPLSALLYASYNLLLAIAVLAPLGAISEKGPLRLGAVLGGIGLGLGAMAITTALITNLGRAPEYEVPMLYIAGTISPAFRAGYSMVLLAEVYTTAVGSLYGFAARVADPDGAGFKVVVIAAGVVAFFASQLGFSNLVRLLYPLVGYAGLILMGSIVYVAARDSLAPIERWVAGWIVAMARLFTGRNRI